MELHIPFVIVLPVQVGDGYSGSLDQPPGAQQYCRFASRFLQSAAVQACPAAILESSMSNCGTSCCRVLLLSRLCLCAVLRRDVYVRPALFPELMKLSVQKNYPDETWRMSQLVGTLCNRRYTEKTVAYAQSHDQSIVGTQQLAPKQPF